MFRIFSIAFDACVIPDNETINDYFSREMEIASANDQNKSDQSQLNVKPSSSQANLPILLRQIRDGRVSNLLNVSEFIVDSLATSCCNSSRNSLAKPSCENNECCSNAGHFGLTLGSAQRHCARKSIATEFHVGKRLRRAVVAGRGEPVSSSAIAYRSRFTRLSFIVCLP